MTLRMFVAAVTGEFEAKMRELETPIRTAGIAAVKEAGKLVKQQAEAAIAAAGLGSRWKSGFKYRVYTDQARNPNQIAAAFFYHRIGLFNVFEKGAQIKGKRLLWLPLPTLPKAFRGFGKRRMTPKRYSEEIGPLVSIRAPGKKPMLAAKVDRGKRGRSKITTAALRRGGRGIGNVKSVPLFVGVPAVTIRKRTNVAAIVDRVNAQIPELYFKHLKVD